MTSRPPDPGVVELLSPDWESRFFKHSFLGFVEKRNKKKLIGLQCFLFHFHFQKHKIGDWILNKIKISNFTWHFNGFFKGQHYCSDFLPCKQFGNHASCKAFSDFLSKEILKRLMVGALRVWERVGDDSLPYLVLTLTLEPTKPRLCLDARYLNLWMTSMPFSLDRLADVPQYVYRGSYITKCDDKSAYGHVSPSPSSQTYVGFQWNGFWFVCTTLPFGWKLYIC